MHIYICMIMTDCHDLVVNLIVVKRAITNLCNIQERAQTVLRRLFLFRRCVSQKYAAIASSSSALSAIFVDQCPRYSVTWFVGQLLLDNFCWPTKLVNFCWSSDIAFTLDPFLTLWNREKAAKHRQIKRSLSSGD